MVDFGKLKRQKEKKTVIEPMDIFRRLPKPPGINDLYTSQAEVLDTWFSRREEHDVVVKLHTGGGKTLVGLLMAQSTLNETNEPVLYLAPNRQLVSQTLEKAKTLGIAAVPYEPGKPLADTFLNGNAIMVGTYKALFNGRSKFGLRGQAGLPTKVSAIILDDAHVAFSVIRDSFTLEVTTEDHRDLYDSLTGLFRHAFKEMDRLGTFDDTVEGTSGGVIEVPYWAWQEQLDVIREQLRPVANDSFGLVWPLLRDHLHLCHALISKKGVSITPILPLVSLFPTFAETPRRIYMSATIADDSEVVRTFNASSELVNNALTSRSLAGISERMILIPDLMPFRFKVRESIEKLLTWTAEKKKFGAVVLVSSNEAANIWSEVATVAEGPAAVEGQVQALQDRSSNGPVVFANRYDGIDLPGDACRLLVMDGLPSGTSDYELFRASTLYGASSINRLLAQRIEQGIGRGARGAGDHCVVVLSGANLAGWVAKAANFRLLTSATRAQLDMGSTVSKEVKDLKELARTIETSFDRDVDWVEYHAETLAENVSPESPDAKRFTVASGERKAFDLWADGFHDKAVTCIEKLIEKDLDLDQQTRGWLLQLAARIANDWGQLERSEDLQRNAFGNNRNLLRPKIMPPYRPLPNPGAQAVAIAEQLHGYRIRRGFLQRFEEVVSHFYPQASANQFEQALAELGQMIGLSTERHDVSGEGPDVLWLLPNQQGFVIEAKSRKKGKNALTKDEHGQLLIAEEWFVRNYPDHTVVRVSVHPSNKATRAASATTSFALTYEKLTALVADARSLIVHLVESQLASGELKAECTRALEKSRIRADRLVSSYLVPFVDE
ncbi:DEAD/DEAH box helicase [Paraburkholderia sediminicola]|uniref:DEAD/DEAH box helicase n=1 Tax=Paraburkholderia sediminicola TaxID=458836 RepID=UPI0038B888AE